MSDLSQRFTWAWEAAGVPGDPEPTFRALRDAYTAPGRVYHALAHIEDGLMWLAALRPSLHQPAATELAWWFHDAVYNPLAHDNEAASAAWAVQALAGAPAPVLAHVERAILATASHGGVDDTDIAALVDVDLSILGASPARYDAFERAVRAEYAQVPDDLWRAGRARVLRGFLQRDRLFTTPALADLQPAARANLSRTLRALETP